MQNQHLKLREIVWEITGQCNNNCSYCGSKSVQKTKVSDEHVIKIANAIAEYPPLEIDISGGDPLLLSFSTHEEVVHILKSEGVKCKILCNPKSLINKEERNFPILELYDWVGISINTLEELELMYKIIYNRLTFVNYTVITNFNISNLYDYDEIEKYVKRLNKLWTIQYTVYEDENNPLAIYNNDSALKTLEEKVNASIQNGVKIILSDNTRNNAPCGAGFCSLGITHDGYVIPCLSMRSWCNPVENCNSNILESSLESIWKNDFNSLRFSEFKCCKDACKNKSIDVYSAPKLNEPPLDINQLTDLIEKNKNIEEIPLRKKPGLMHMMYAVPGDFNDRTVLYAVRPDNDGGNVFIYGVQDNQRVLYYGVMDYNQYIAYAVNDGTSNIDYKNYLNTNSTNSCNDSEKPKDE